MQFLAMVNIFIVKTELNSTFTNKLKRKYFFSKNVQSCRLSLFNDKTDWSILLAGSSLVWPKCDLLTTDVFVLHAYWVNWADLQMQRWDGSIHYINAICADLGQKCLQLLCLYALSGCDTISYPCYKGNVTSLNTMVTGNYQWLAIIGDINTTQTELMIAAMPSFVSL